MQRSALNIDLGLSDDEDSGPPTRGRPQAREESVSDLIGGRDPTLMFSGGGSGTMRGGRKSQGFNFDTSGGGDPLDALKDSFARRNSAPATSYQDPEVDEEELRFQMEFQREMGLLGGDESAASQGHSALHETLPARRTPSPAPQLSHRDDGSDESLADIVGDIMDDAPRPSRTSPSPVGRRNSAPPASISPRVGFGELSGQAAASQHSAPGSRRGSLTPGSRRGDARDDGRGEGQGDESPAPMSRQGRPPRAGSRPPLDAADDTTPREDYSPTGGGYEQEMPRGGARDRREGSLAPSMASDREGSVASDRGSRTMGLESMQAGDESYAGRGDASMTSLAGRGGRRPPPPRPPADDNDPLADILGEDAGPARGARRAGSPAMGSGAESRGSTTPTGRGGTDGSGILSAAPAFEVELTAKPKRKLGGPKAKASPAPSATRSPPPEEDIPARAVGTPMSGRTTPQAGPPTPLYHEDQPPVFGGRSATPPPLPSQQNEAPAPQPRPVSPAPSLPMGGDTDNENDDDLDDLLQDNTSAAPAMSQPSPRRASAQDDSDSELPDFMRGSREPRARRGDPTPKAAPKMSPKSAAMGADLGLSAEDLEPSDQSASMTMQAAAAEDASGSGSALMDVQLSIKPKGGRRFPKAKAKASGSASLDDEGMGSSASWPQPQQASPAHGAAFQQLQRGSPAHSASPSVTPSGAQSGSARVPSSVPAASEPAYSGSAGGSVGIPVGGATGYGYPGFAASGLPSPGANVGIQGAGVAVPSHPGIDAFPPSMHGDQALPTATLPRSLQPADGLPPGSPFTQTARSESASLQARFPADGPTHAGAATASAMAYAGAMGAAGSPLPSDARRSAAAGGGTPGSEPVLSLFGNDFMQVDGGRAFGGFSVNPPLAAAPSADLLSKLAYSEAKVRQLELQLEDCDQRWVQRLSDSKLQSEAEHERMELQCHRLEAELERGKDTSAADLRHLNEKKQLMLQNFDMEKENARRDERRKAQLDIEKLRADHTHELEELHRRHERSISIAQQQADMEADSLKKAQSGEQQLSRLIEQVQGSVAEVDRMSRRVDSDKSLEWNVRERQLEAREKTVREMEARLSAQSKEVENQRHRVSELVRHMEDSQVDDREALKLERERLQDEHARLLSLQQSVRDADRNNKEALKHAWGQLEDEKHSFQQVRISSEGELQAHREETELFDRQQRQETERLKNVHNQVEVARQNASRRIRETEATIASERRALMSDLEVFEEKRRIFAAEVQKFEEDRRSLTEERGGFEQEVRSVGQMACEVQRRSEELMTLQSQAGEARGELLKLRDQLGEERSAHGSELERLKTMQTLVEQQRLQLLQTENQFRMRGIEDIDVMMTTQATFPADAGGFFPGDAAGLAAGAGAGGMANPFEAFGAPLPAAMASGPSQDPGDYAKLFAQQGHGLPAAAMPAGQASTTWAGRGISNLGQRMPATPGVAGSTGHRQPAGGHDFGGADAVGGGSRMELQTLLRRTKESSGDVLYIQEQFRFLQQSQSQPGPMSRDTRQMPGGTGGGFGGGGIGAGAAGFGGGGIGGGMNRMWPGALSAGMPAVSRGLHHHAMLAPSHSTSTEDDEYASPTLEGIRPLSSDIEGTSAGSGA